MHVVKIAFRLSFRSLLGVIVFCGLAHGAPPSPCPDFPGYDETQKKYEGKISLSLLTKILDSLSLSGAVEDNRKVILDRYPDSAVLFRQLVMYSSVCRWIENDPSLSPTQKTDKIWGIAQVIFGIKAPTPATAAPASSTVGVLPPPSVANPSPPKTLEFNLGSQHPANFFDLDDVHLTVVNPGTADARVITYIGAIRPRCLPFGDGKVHAKLIGYAQYANTPEHKFELREFSQSAENHYKETAQGPNIGPEIPTGFRLDAEGKCGK
jgi:hypothetical protein